MDSTELSCYRAPCFICDLLDACINGVKYSTEFATLNGCCLFVTSLLILGWKKKFSFSLHAAQMCYLLLELLLPYCMHFLNLELSVAHVLINCVVFLLNRCIHFGMSALKQSRSLLRKLSTLTVVRFISTKLQKSSFITVFIGMASSVCMFMVRPTRTGITGMFIFAEAGFLRIIHFITALLSLLRRHVQLICIISGLTTLCHCSV